jgi:hypothetical protein
MRERDPRWFSDSFYSVRITEDLEVFFADTSVFVEDYYQYSWAYEIQEGLAFQDPEEQLLFLRAAMGNSTADFKFLVGHHPIYSNGFNGGYTDVGEALVPLIDEYGIVAYINGHDHSQEHIIKNETNYFTSGAGSLTYKGPWVERDPARFENNDPGFMAFVFDEEACTAYFFNDNATGLYNYTMPRPSLSEEDQARVRLRGPLL